MSKKKGKITFIISCVSTAIIYLVLEKRVGGLRSLMTKKVYLNTEIKNYVFFFFLLSFYNMTTNRREELEPLVSHRKDNWRWFVLLSFSFFSFSSALMFVRSLLVFKRKL